MQSFCRALVELNVLKFVTWILPQLTARYIFSNQPEAGFPTNQKLAWRKFELQEPQPESISSNTRIFGQFFHWWLRLRGLQVAGLFSGFL